MPMENAYDDVYETGFDRSVREQLDARSRGQPFWAMISAFAGSCLIGIVAVLRYPASGSSGAHTGPERWFAAAMLLIALWVLVRNRAHWKASLAAAALCIGAAAVVAWSSSSYGDQLSADAALRGLNLAPSASYLQALAAVLAAVAAVGVASLPRLDELSDTPGWPKLGRHVQAATQGVLIGVLVAGLVIPLAAVLAGPLRDLERQVSIDAVSDIRVDLPGPGPAADSGPTGPAEEAPSEPGAELWSLLNEDVEYYGASIAEGLALVLVGQSESSDSFSQGVIAYDLTNGEEVWRHLYQRPYVRGLVTDRFSGHALLVLPDIAVLISMESGATIRTVDLPDAVAGNDVSWALVTDGSDGPPVREMRTAVLVARADHPLRVIGLSLEDGDLWWRVNPASTGCRFAATYDPSLTAIPISSKQVWVAALSRCA